MIDFVNKILQKQQIRQKKIWRDLEWYSFTMCFCYCANVGIKTYYNVTRAVYSSETRAAYKTNILYRFRHVRPVLFRRPEAYIKFSMKI